MLVCNTNRQSQGSAFRVFTGVSFAIVMNRSVTGSRCNWRYCGVTKFTQICIATLNTILTAHARNPFAISLKRIIKLLNQQCTYSSLTIILIIYKRLSSKQTSPIIDPGKNRRGDINKLVAMSPRTTNDSFCLQAAALSSIIDRSSRAFSLAHIITRFTVSLCRWRLFNAWLLRS